MTRSETLDKRGRTIRDMFAGVAPRYDLLNHVLSGGLDVLWRRRAAAVLSDAERDRVLDLCCGTGDQATTLARRGARVQAVDFCLPMLTRATPKFQKLSGVPHPTPLAADALASQDPARRTRVQPGQDDQLALELAQGGQARTVGVQVIQMRHDQNVATRLPGQVRG